MMGVKDFLLTLFVLSIPVSSMMVQAGESIQVGFVKTDIDSVEMKQTIPLMLFYPTNSPEKQVMFGPFSMNLAIGSPIAEGKYPLVVLSHGSGGSNLSYRSIIFSLVKNGFVVAAPLHPGNNFRDNRAVGHQSNWVNRPKHIKLVLDHIESSNRFSHQIDWQKVAILGHSAGGYTALAVSGGIADTSYIRWLCRQSDVKEAVFCQFGQRRDTGNDGQSTTVENVRDKRVKALVLLAPVGIVFKEAKSLDAVTLPILILRAEKDDELVEPYQADIIAENLPNKALLDYRVIKNAGHYSFITPVPEPLKAELGVIAQDPAGFDRRAFHRELGGEISNYLSRVL